MKISVIICAAGKGTRVGAEKNKLFLKYDELTVIEHTLSAFQREDVSEIVVATAKEDVNEMQKLCSSYPNVIVTEGGETRTRSVKKALSLVSGTIVLVHDGARPFVSEKIISDCIQCVLDYGSAVCSLPMTDTVAVVEKDRIKGVPDRSILRSLQTPQGFFTEDLVKAYERAGDQEFTDDSSVYAAYIAKPRYFTGEARNRKITYPEDLTVTGERVGYGVDTHAFGKESDHIVLCGVKVPCDRELVAHSDGDVAIHALMDAMLTAAGLRDIGYYFPEADDRYKDADSTNMLRYVVTLLKEQGFKVQNISLAIQAQKPRLKNYILPMKKTLAELLRLDKNAVGIAAGTNEGLGYVGEGKGITVTAVVLLRNL